MNPYAVLHLTGPADQATIRRAFLREAKRWHPDYNSDPEAHDHFCALSLAYKQLQTQRPVATPMAKVPFIGFITYPPRQTSTWEVFL
jgi:hypothetical protein